MPANEMPGKLEGEFEADFHLTRSVSKVAVRVGDGAERRVGVQARGGGRASDRATCGGRGAAGRNDVARVVDAGVIHVVEEIVRLADDFEAIALGKRELLRDAKVHDLSTRQAVGIAPDHVDTRAATGAIDATGEAAGCAARGHE